MIHGVHPYLLRVHEGRVLCLVLTQYLGQLRMVDLMAGVVGANDLISPLAHFIY